MRSVLETKSAELVEKLVRVPPLAPDTGRGADPPSRAESSEVEVFLDPTCGMKCAKSVVLPIIVLRNQTALGGYRQQLQALVVGLTHWKTKCDDNMEDLLDPMS